jgi:hypothetical protein
MNDLLRQIAEAVGVTGGIYYLVDKASITIQQIRFTRTMKKLALTDSPPPVPLLLVEHRIRCIDCGEPLRMVRPPGVTPVYVESVRSCKEEIDVKVTP